MHFEPKDEGLTRGEAALHLVHRVRHALIQHGFGFKGVALSGGGGFGGECGNVIRPFALGTVADLGDAFNAAADLHCFSMWPLVSLPTEKSGWAGYEFLRTAGRPPSSCCRPFNAPRAQPGPVEIPVCSGSPRRVVNHPPANRRQHGLDEADIVFVDGQVIAIEHDEIGKHARGDCTFAVFFPREPRTATGVGAQRLFARQAFGWAHQITAPVFAADQPAD